MSTPKPVTFRRPGGLPTGIITDEQGNPTKVCIPWQTWKTLVKEHDQIPSTSSSAKLRAASQQPARTATTSFPGFNIPSTTPSSKASFSFSNPSGKSSSLPPGIVLDEHGKPCKVCNSWQTWAKIAKKQDSHSPASKAGKSGSTNGAGTGTGGKSMAGVFGAAALGTSSSSTTTAIPSDTATTEETSPEPTRPPDCPPDVAELGRATWTFLHTSAAYYPPHATGAQQTSMRAFITALGEFYPCTWCATDFREKVKQAGGVRVQDVAGREALSRWFCERHNEVNEKLGKEVFDCAKVQERWKDGPADGSCD
ncbi:hypothetical protein QFC21_002115 [Naganishia friedmannii]|uniref:Uncharacterized protein n=1 Tax=Naganishia friedmannii TaxID=89922 RepID=A0ACC2VZ60_9TREE|nr:hypothetical protein QFC21_002115 [Naganishia friedmannii]